MKHIIMVSIDNLRFDCIGYQPNKKELAKYNLEDILKTPTLDSLAKKSVCFTNVVSTSTYTTTSHASIITGLFPPRHGLRGFFDKISDKIITLAELFKLKGYLTILSTDEQIYWKNNGLSRGFTNIFERQDEKLYEFLDLHKSENMFVFIHYFDIHDPYLFSEYEIYENYNVDYYDMIDGISKEFKLDLDRTNKDPWNYWTKLSIDLRKDKKIFFPIFVKGVNKFDKGRFNELITSLQTSDFLDDSLLVIFSDHGEGRFMQDNKDCFGNALRSYHDNMSFGHAGRLYDDVIRVPLIIYNKNIKHRIIDIQISTVDIFPTIIDMCFNNFDLPYKIDGQSLMKEIYDINKNYDHLAYSEVSTPYPYTWETSNTNWILHQRSIRYKGIKYIVSGRPEIFVESTFMAFILFISSGRVLRYMNKVNNSIFSLPNEIFIKEVYKNILGRNIDEQDFKCHLTSLNNNIMTKKEFFIYLLTTEKYGIRKFTIFDLKKDPEELFPIDPIKNPFYLIRFFNMFKRIIDIEKSAIFNRKQITIIDEDERKIKERLKDLGYI